MKKFEIPTREQVVPDNQKIFDTLKSALGFVPNAYAFLAHSPNALEQYLQYDKGKTSLSAKETEVVHLVTSQVDDCEYCLSAHTAIAKGAGFTDEQIIGIRKGKVPFDAKLEALAQFTCEMVKSRGHVQAESIEHFYKAGYTDENLVDVILSVSKIMVTNLLNNVTRMPVDFLPKAPKIESSECSCGCHKK